MKYCTRQNTKKVNVGGVIVGGGAPVVVQSMTNTPTKDVKKTVAQIKALQNTGCEIVRVSVPCLESAKAIKQIKKNIKIPLVADIHFDASLAIEAIKHGADALRINPGNIGAPERVEAVVKEAKKAGIPIRVGVNAGSLKEAHGANAKNKAKILVNAALENIKILEKHKFYNIVVSLKASDIATTVEAYKLFATKRNYPLHLGITEAGTLASGTVKSCAGLAILLYGGLGDTIRVSLTADPVEEVKVAYSLLNALDLRRQGVEIISCPTCARCQVNLIDIVNKFEGALRPIKVKKPLKVALMGCVVNGPGEAAEADFGIAGSADFGVLFEKGKVVGKVSPDKWVKTLINIVKKRG
ncbi:MAG: flavodoxin-dependent (E)-4-hydroxy-3-methylbut-2-enyl-diphosphate synthase [Elusimicrobia bacterium]|nr:flavodoxin-dependent (E)-4-hydroxy-3-methylbut-2-enyl-diphosphate synthase [Elusimicrobiota bacterium]